MKYKQGYEVTALNNLIVSEYENEDEIYVVRECYEEYVGHLKKRVYSLLQ